MSDTTKRKKPNMIHIGIGILTVLLVVFIVILMQLVSNIQGTARVVNYEGTEKHTIFILTLIKKKKSIRVFMILVDFLLDKI